MSSRATFIDEEGDHSLVSKPILRRPLGLVYAGAAVTNMFFYFVQTFLGPHPPSNTAYYLAFNLPWLIAPMVLGLRVYFGRDIESAEARAIVT